jgi:Caspase recruitment domain
MKCTCFTGGDENETCWPLTEKQRNIVKKNQHPLAKMIEIDTLLPILYSSNCITRVHHEYIQSNVTTYKRNVCFLEVLLKRSQADYLSFINALIEIDQSHVARIFSEGGGGL